MKLPDSTYKNFWLHLCDLQKQSIHKIQAVYVSGALDCLGNPAEPVDCFYHDNGLAMHEQPDVAPACRPIFQIPEAKPVTSAPLRMPPYRLRLRRPLCLCTASETTRNLPIACITDEKTGCN